MDYSKTQLGERIALLRKGKKTQEQLADMLSPKEDGTSITAKHLSAVERGVSGLSLELLIQIAQIFECSLDYLVFGKSSDELSAHIPEHIQEIYRSGSESEIRILNSYLEMYKIVKEQKEQKK